MQTQPLDHTTDAAISDTGGQIDAYETSGVSPPELGEDLDHMRGLAKASAGALAMVLQIACVVEAVLEDLALRILQHSREGIPSLPPSKLAKVRKKVEKSKEHLGFRRVISIFAESNVFDEDPAFYARLVELSTLRNRVHISNRKHMEPADKGICSWKRPKLTQRNSAKS